MDSNKYESAKHKINSIYVIGTCHFIQKIRTYRTVKWIWFLHQWQCNIICRKVILYKILVIYSCGFRGHNIKGTIPDWQFHSFHSLPRRFFKEYNQMFFEEQGR